jgi:hypothetical protein
MCTAFGLGHPACPRRHFLASSSHCSLPIGHAKTSQLEIGRLQRRAKTRLDFNPPTKGQQNCPIGTARTLQIWKKTQERSYKKDEI